MSLDADIWQPGYLSQGAYIKVTRTGVSLGGSHMTPTHHMLYIHTRVARAARAPRADFIYIGGLDLGHQG